MFNTARKQRISTVDSILSSINQHIAALHAAAEHNAALAEQKRAQMNQLDREASEASGEAYRARQAADNLSQLIGAPL